MMPANRRWKATCAIAAGLVLGGCMVAKQPAPVVQRTPESARSAAAKSKPTVPAARATRDARPHTYTVKRGDTLYGIALDHGHDHRDIARWNNLANPNAIEVGQVLRVREPAVEVAAAQPDSGETGAAATVTTPYQAASIPQGREVGVVPVPPVAEAGQDAGIISTPKAVKLPYSDAALAKLRAAPADTSPTTTARTDTPAAKPEVAVAKPESPPASEENDGVAWAWPTQGKVVANFNENGGPKGMQIAGEMGQAILASAGGRVVYTGSGLRGYGNLVIIKHNNTYLSAYAHNRSVLVKQGDTVARGQKIAEMGSSDASRVMLHFEIRRLGKPVDPTKFLPPA
jgi:lipoprotein NlpD